MKNLRTVQVLAGIGRVLSKIVFVFSIVGASLCAAGIVSFALLGDGGLKIGGVTLRAFIEKEAGLSAAETYAAMGTGLVFLVAEIIVSAMAVRYFRHELEAGTPFTAPLARELAQGTHRPGVGRYIRHRITPFLHICAGLGASIICGIALSVMKVVGQTANNVSYGGSFSAGIGIAMIVVSVICDYGAELRRGE